MAETGKGRYRTRLADGEADVTACQRLRFRAFRSDAESGEAGLDRDAFDPICRHVMVEERDTGRLVCCYRILPLENGAEIGRSYSAQWYELSNLEDFPGRMLEMGRFCIDPEVQDPTILRLAWAEVTRFVDEHDVKLLFGCSSFQGLDEDAYVDAFALLKERHIAPKRWLPRVKAPKVFRFARKLRLKKPDLKKALSRMPPLLRTYLTLGGWVSDHAVIDSDLGTLHVFTGVEIGAVPERRAELFRRAQAAL